MSPTQSAANNGSPSSNTASQCSNCKESNVELKRCTKCLAAACCNRECQTAHWRLHRSECGSLDMARSDSASTIVAAGAKGFEETKRPDAHPFTAICNNTFLHDRTETETFNILIEVFRMKQEDAIRREGYAMAGTIYNGQQNSVPAFRAFLAMARNVTGLLPPWWSDAKNAECLAYGARENHDFSLSDAQTEAHIQAQWKDQRMPMKLRILGDKVYCHGLEGQPADSVLSRMVAQGVGSSEEESSRFDMTQMLSELDGLEVD